MRDGLTASLEGTVSGIREDEKRLGDESRPEAAYVKRENCVANLVGPACGARAKHGRHSPNRNASQKQIIRLLNLLVTDDSSAASAQTNKTRRTNADLSDCVVRQRTIARQVRYDCPLRSGLAVHSLSDVRNERNNAVHARDGEYRRKSQRR